MNLDKNGEAYKVVYKDILRTKDDKAEAVYPGREGFDTTGSSGRWKGGKYSSEQFPHFPPPPDARNNGVLLPSDVPHYTP
jgi:hypothetical protein